LFLGDPTIVIHVPPLLQELYKQGEAAAVPLTEKTIHKQALPVALGSDFHGLIMG
jgi:hypothetical protein